MSARPFRHQPSLINAMQPRQADATSEDDGFSVFSMNVTARSVEPEPNRKPMCCYCGRGPGEKEDFPKCAQCRSIFYCSRECQKKDWAGHKKHCKEPDKQRSFMVKCICRMNQDQKLMRALSLALGETLFETFTTASDSRKMWIACANLHISPCREEDFNALISPNIPFNVLLDKPMEGKLNLIGFNDVSEKDSLIEERDHALWQKLRDDMDRSGCADNTFVVLVQFGYSKTALFFLPLVVHTRDLELHSMTQSKGSSPGPCLQYVNHELASLEDSKGRKMRCLLGEHDKNLLWAWSRSRVGNTE